MQNLDKIEKKNLELTKELDHTRKELEAKARELEIEASLERVRTVAMSMNTSGDLLNICQVNFSELTGLGFTSLRCTLIHIFKEGDDHYIDYEYSEATGGRIAEVPFKGNTKVEAFFESIRRSKDAFEEVTFQGKELSEFKRFRKATGQVDDSRLDKTKTLYYYFYSIGLGNIGISNFDPIDDAQLQILKRFRNVFDLAYRRYADIAKAEAQAKEAQIELALERVRSRSMGMQKSEDLKEVIQLVYDQFEILQVSVEHTGFIIDYKTNDDMHIWLADRNNIPNKVVVPYFDAPHWNGFIAAKKRGESFYSTHHTAEETTSFYTKLFQTLPGFPEALKEYYLARPGLDISTVLLDNVGLYIERFSGVPYSDEDNAVLMRFGKVFQQTYTRFLDLQKAEAQAREAQVEAALERVRARTMAMHSSDELIEASDVMLAELKKLDIHALRIGICTIDQETGAAELWSRSEVNGKAQKSILGTVPPNVHPVFDDMVDAWRKGKPSFSAMRKGLAVEEYYQALSPYLSYPLPDVFNEQEVLTAFFFPEGALNVISVEHLQSEEHVIMLRFANVFGLIYRRFLDLQKAEAQARESQIQLALERVRARTMAMQQSEELQEAAIVLFNQMQALGFDTGSCGFNIWTKQTDAERPDEKAAVVWASSPEGGLQRHFELPHTQSPLYKAVYKACQRGEKIFIRELSGKKLKDHFDYLLTLPGIREVISKLRNQNYKFPKKVIFHFAFFKQGYLTFHGHNEDPAAADILKRFAKVFEQTYTRFLDLQKVEAQAREANIEAALEKVRSRSLAVHTSNEFGEVVKVVFERLQELSIPMTSASINVIIPGSKDTEAYICASGNDGLIVSHIRLVYFDHPISNDRYIAHQSGLDFFSKSYSIEEKDSFFKYQFEASDLKFIPSDIKRMVIQSQGYTTSIAFAKNSMIVVNDFEGKVLSPNEIDIVKRFSKVFEQAYIRFLDLQKAESQAREAQIEAALEKVRSRSLAMHKSVELKEVVSVVLKKLQELGFVLKNGGAVILIFSENSKDVVHWVASPDLLQSAVNLTFPYFDHPVNVDLFDAVSNQIDYYFKTYSFEEKNEFYLKAFEISDYKFLPDDLKQWLLATESYTLSFALERKSAIVIFDFYQRILSDSERQILKRIAKVFEQAYVRFLDLQKAEKQARESQIEAALERVRSRTIAMQKSEDMNTAASDMFNQIQSLGMQPWACGFNIFDQDEKAVTQYMSLADGGISPPFRTPLTEDPFFINIYEGRQRGDELLVWESKGESLAQTYRYMFGLPGSGEIFGDLENSGFEMPKFQITHCAYFSQGYLVFITYEPVPEAYEIFTRFAKVFEQTYTRFLDLQKAEAQARESQIQLALERVRARTMAMQHSNELSETAHILFRQFRQLGESPFQITIGIFKEELNQIEFNITGGDGSGSKVQEAYRMSIDEPALLNKIFKAWKENKKSGVIDLDASAMRKWIGYRNHITGASESVENIHENYKRYVGLGFFSKGFISFSHTEIVTTETIGVLERFAKVFDQTYTRFLDLQKAEAQARENQIQLALERVRARTMAMQRSEELPETSYILFKQMKDLGEAAEQLTIGVVREENNAIEISATLHGDMLKKIYSHSIDEPFMMNKVYNAWKNQQKTLVVELKGDELNAYNKYRNELTNSDMFPTNLGNDHRRIVYAAFFSKGMLALAADDPRPQSLELLERFASVFDLTYTRFLDLQRAEAQAREGQIQLALERVRARTMAMQKSDELSEAAALLFKQISDLGFETWTSGFNIWQNNDTSFIGYNPSPTGGITPPYVIPSSEDNFFLKILRAKESGKDAIVFEWSGEQLAGTYNYMKTLPTIGEVLKGFEEAGIALPTFQINHVVFFAQGFLLFITLRPYPEAPEIFKRFGKTFEQTYTRFLDLQKAEAQAREAKIEAALEKIRSRSLSMTKADELGEVVTLVVEKLRELDVPVDDGVALVTHIEGSKDQVEWMENPGLSSALKIHQPYYEHPILADYWKAKNEGVDFIAPRYTTEENKSFLQHIFQNTDYKYTPKHIQEYCLAAESYSYSAAFQKNSSIFINDYSNRPLTEAEIDIVKRLSKVFEHAYVRFLDLQTSEMQARESQIQLGLERVRARTLAMQKSEELPETSAIVFQQLIKLGIAPNRLYICIMKNDTGDAEFWITEEDGTKVSKGYEDNLNNNPSFKKMYEGWKQEKKILVIDMHGGELQDYFDHLSSLNVPFKGGLMQKRRLQYLAYFSKGFIGMASPDEQSEETLQLLERFAYTFNLTFTRFNDLKIAEAHAVQAEHDLIEIKAARKKAEDTLSELQSTQQQLIQSEKMASLGELTAGIAHEIQNPLNFVNNFSEVSKELLDEMQAALKNGDEEEAREIAVEIIQNLEKINHHGKRADAIVKGMLQHSRQAKGVKQQTNINALCDEYLRLAYHGMRAKDKSFQADLKTEFEENVGMVNVVPQDIGRVLLNLFNNAFYACAERTRKSSGNYHPLVFVGTKIVSDKIELTVSDNAYGIPQSIVDKIFQPFFTTKPTGQGTGLGLSLTYDIIKAHGGEIKLESSEGVGTTFVIMLPNV